MAQERKLPAPQANAETKAFWDACGEGKLSVGKCGGCGKVHYYPRALCPFCFSDKVSLLTTAGKGTLYSYSVMRRAPVPYAIAYVTLAEGPTMLTNMVDCDFDKLKLGQAVKLVFKPTEGNGPPLPCFAPA